MLRKKFVNILKSIDWLAVGIAVVIAVVMLLMMLKIANTSCIATIEQPNGVVQELEVNSYNYDDGVITLWASNGEKYIVGTENCSIKKVK